MALLAPQDWQPPRDSSPSQNPRSMEPRNINHNHNLRQSSPDPHSQSTSAQLLQQQTPSNNNNNQQSYPLQPWQPSLQAPPFYPAYPSYFPPQQPHPQHHPHSHPSPSSYFDPNQHFAQWAYQQMLMSAQAQAYHAHQQQQQQPQHPFTQTQQQQADYSRSRANSGTATSPQDFASFQRTASEQQATGFQSYPRRPSRQGSPASAEPPQPPYARADAAGSSSSIGSGSSGRSRTGSNPATPQQHLRSTSAGPPSRTDRDRERDRDRDRRGTSSERPTEPRRTTKPSPLAQETYPTRGRERERVPSPRPETPTTARSEATTRTSTSTARPETATATTTPAANKRLSISKDDSQIGPSAPAPSGLKGRLRRALSFNATSALENGTDAPEDPARGSRRTALAHASKVNAAATAAAASSPSPTSTSPISPESPPTPTGPPPPKSRARRAASLFNTKLNASTDNISLSSTVSSASVMIRKLGSMGRLARKNSLMGITGLFKDKDKDKSSGAEGSGSGSHGKGKKGATAAASVTHATAEVDRASGSDNLDISGLSPAAKLARQHTIRSNEEAAARQRAAAEEARARDAAAVIAQAAGGVGGAPVAVWERGTATRAARRAVLVEDGDGSFEEDDGSGSGSDDGSENGTYDAHRGWDDEEDVTIRVGSVQPQVHLPPPPQDDEEVWAVGLRRSVERTRRPAKGILKNATTYDQDAFLDLPPNTTFARVRSNSYNQAPQNKAEPGPLARIPSPDPDHIDGLHPHKPAPMNDFIPPFTFEDAPRSESPTKAGFFNLTNLNSSAPALSTMQGHVSPPPLAHRAATTPAKRLAFAANLSIYDTFSPLVYDRRSEPATCNRLTPALAQRIKEELNSYKMEEMEVHAASRVHTQFFV